MIDKQSGPVGVIRKTALAPFTAMQMYALVNAIEDYPAFVPWCSSAVVHERRTDALVASLGLGIGKLRQQLMTANTMQPGRRIDMCLIAGPFSRLDGHWAFDDVEGGRCRVSLYMDFEFKNNMLRPALNKAYQQLNYALVDVFTRRAHAVYGTDAA